MKRLPQTKHYSMTGTQLSILIEKGIALGQLDGQGSLDRKAYEFFLTEIHKKTEKYENAYFNLSTSAGRRKAREHFAAD